MIDRWTSPVGRWSRPRKVLEYYVEQTAPDMQEAKKRLFLAVVSGEVRARLGDTILDPRWFKHTKFDAHDPLALPPDIELSVEDARRKWFGD